MQPPDLNVIELRQYTMQPGRRAELVRLFERQFIETQNAVGLHVLGIFGDAERDDRFVWLRGFTDMAARKQGLQTFYGGPVWRAHRAAANATMIDSSDVLLLRPLTAWTAPPPPTPGAAAGQPWQALICTLTGPPDDSLRAALRDDDSAAWLETESAPNTFPALPVREGESVVVGLARAGSAALGVPLALQPRLAGPAQRRQLEPTPRSPLR